MNAHVRPSMEKVDTYFNEHGTTIRQRTYKDSKGNMMISEVPAHNGKLETKWVFDLDEVSDDSKEAKCEVILF